MKKKIVLLLGVFAVTILIITCTKDISTKPANPSNPEVPTYSFDSEYTGFNSFKDNLCVCYGFTIVQDDEGNYGKADGNDCSKIVPCPCDDNGEPDPAAIPGNGDDVFNIGNFENFIKRAEEGNQTKFFKTGQWRHVFNDLIRKPEVLAGLQDGTIAFAEVVSSIEPTLFYFAVDVNLLPASGETFNVAVEEIQDGMAISLDQLRK